MIYETQQLLLNIISFQLFHNPMPSLKNADWTQLMEEAANQGVYKIVYNAVEQQIPKKLIQKFKPRYFAETAAGIRNNYQHGQLHNLMTVNDIPYVIIKGMASASYYPDPLLRTTGDIDFLVLKEDIPRATAQLENAGYKITGKGNQVHVAFHKQKERFEMHWDLNGIPNGKMGDLCRKCLKDIIETETDYINQDNVYFIPDDFHHGLVILIHTAKHMINTGIGLRHLSDWAVFAGKIEDDDFRSLFERKLRKIGLWRFAQLLTQISIKYLGCPEKQWAMENVDADLLEEMIKDILDSGNFGRKDTERINEAKLMTTEGTGTIHDSKIVIFKALTEKAFWLMPACKKFKILLPVGWMFVGIRHLILVAKGRRSSIHIRRMVTGANKRKKIYSKFQLFQL